MPKALTIAGSDPTCGAGMQADLATFSALGVDGASAVTAITVQTREVLADVHPLPAELVARQIDAALSIGPIQAWKIGMLATADIVRAAAERARRHAPAALVLDPVLAAGAGGVLLEEEGVEPLVRELLPLATVITPNSEEAERLTGIAVRDLTGAARAARALCRMGARFAVVTGGHFTSGPQLLDTVCEEDRIEVLRGPRVPAADLHGTGCRFSAAIAAALALGADPPEAIRRAKRHVAAVLRQRGPAPGRETPTPGD